MLKKGFSVTDFAKNFSRQRRSIAYLSLGLGIIVGATLLVYGQDLAVIFSNSLVFTSGNVGNYVLAVPLMALVVIHRKRHVLNSVIFREDRKRWFSDPTGIALILTAAVLFLYGSSTLYAPYYHTYSMILFLCGATILVFNFSTFRHVFFAIAILTFLQPPPGELIAGIAADISWVSAVLVNNALHILAIPADLTSNLGAPTFLVTKPGGQQNTFVIGEPSSGVFSTIGMSVFALFVAYISGGRVWKRTALFAASFPLFFLLNTTRIGVIILLWFFFNSDAAESFHLVGGMLMVTIGTIALLIIGERVFGIPYIRPRLSVLKCELCDACQSRHEQFCLMCGRRLGDPYPRARLRWILSFFLIVLVGTSVYTASNVSSAVDTSKGIESLNIRSVKGDETVPYVLPVVAPYTPVFAYRDKATESVLNQDLALAYRYVNLNSSLTDTTQPYVGIQISNGKHTWEDSLITYPSSVGRPSAKVIDLEDITINHDQTATFFMYQRVGSNTTEAVVYWFERLPLNFGSHLENRNVFIVLWIYTNSLVRDHVIAHDNDAQGTKHYLTGFANPIKDFWSGITSHAIAYSLLNNFMERNAPLLFFLSIVPASAIVLSKYMKRRSVGSRYQKLFANLAVPSDKTVIVAAAECEPKASVGRNLAAKFNSHIAGRVQTSVFVNLLKNAEEAGFLKGEVATRNDIPYFVWRPAFGRRSGALRPILRSIRASIWQLIRQSGSSSSKGILAIRRGLEKR